jgi:hypothetical protein
MSALEMNEDDMNCTLTARSRQIQGGWVFGLVRTESIRAPHGDRLTMTKPPGFVSLHANGSGKPTVSIGARARSPVRREAGEYRLRETTDIEYISDISCVKLHKPKHIHKFLLITCSTRYH